jgi:hypothetical protein
MITDGEITKHGVELSVNYRIQGARLRWPLLQMRNLVRGPSAVVSSRPETA